MGGWLKDDQRLSHSVGDVQLAFSALQQCKVRYRWIRSLQYYSQGEGEGL